MYILSPLKKKLKGKDKKTFKVVVGGTRGCLEGQTTQRHLFFFAVMHLHLFLPSLWGTIKE